MIFCTGSAPGTADGRRMALALTDELLREMLDQIAALAGRPRRLDERAGGLTNRTIKITTPDAVYVALSTDASSGMLGIPLLGDPQ